MYTEKEISNKYSNIENKIPGVWKTEMLAALNLQQDLTELGKTITDTELCRVIGLFSKFNPSFYNNVITPGFEFNALYPNIQKINNIKPEGKDISDKLDRLINI